MTLHQIYYQLQRGYYNNPFSVLLPRRPSPDTTHVAGCNTTFITPLTTAAIILFADSNSQEMANDHVNNNLLLFSNDDE